MPVVARRSLVRFVAAAVLLLLIAAVHAPSAAGAPATTSVPPSGTLTEYYWAYEGDIEPIEIQLDGELLNTGVISFSLDLTNPSDQVTIFDFDSMTQEYHVDLIVNAPLLENLGEPPQKLHVDLMGPLTNLDPPELQPFSLETILIESHLNGGGTFGAGQLFEGWRYSNIQINKKENTIIINGDGNVTEVKPSQENNVEGDVEGDLIDPTETQIIPLTGTGEALLNPTPYGVGGILELFVDSADPPARASEGGGAASFPYAATAGIAAAAAVALAAGALYARRRLS